MKKESIQKASLQILQRELLGNYEMYFIKSGKKIVD